VVDQTKLSEDEEKQVDELYRQVGICLSAWNNVEYHLSTVFAAALASHAVGAIGNAFWSVHSFEARLELVHCTLRAEFEQDPVWKPWLALRNKALRELNETRNKIAHGTVVKALTKFGKGDEPSVYEIVVIPYYYARMADPRTWVKVFIVKDTMNLDYLRKADLEKAKEVFVAIIPAIAEVQAKVAEKKKPPTLGQMMAAKPA
jgi:hypothetical protein